MTFVNLSSYRAAEDMKTSILQRLQQITPAIQYVCSISRVPGLSLGVLHEGQVVYGENFGYRHVEQKLPTTSDTIYSLGSLSKAFTAASLGILVQDGRASWSTPVRDILKEFHFTDPTVTEEMTILDVLSHRIGLQRSNQLWTGSSNVLLLDKSQTIPHIEYLKLVKPFRKKFQYSNWGYALAGELIEQLSGQKWSEFLDTKILKPLNMSRTWTGPPSTDYSTQDIAKGYSILDDGSFYPLPPVEVCGDSIMGAAQGTRSSVNDMLKWAAALTQAENDQWDTGSNSTPGLPLKQVPAQMTAHSFLSSPGENEKSYGMGWMRTQLPQTLGNLGCNPGFVKNMPIVGKGTSELLIYHQGSQAGYTKALLNDAADWVAQLVLETLLDIPPNDYKLYATQSAKAHVDSFTAMRKYYEEKRVPGTSPKPLASYVGRYFNSIRNFHIDINIVASSGKETLQMALQGLPSQAWEMEHYHHDTFLWLMSRDDAVKRGRFTYSPAKLYKFEFESIEHGSIEALRWEHDGDLPNGELFIRESGHIPYVPNAVQTILQSPAKATAGLIFLVLLCLGLHVIVKGWTGKRRGWLRVPNDYEEESPKCQ